MKNKKVARGIKLLLIVLITAGITSGFSSIRDVKETTVEIDERLSSSNFVDGDEEDGGYWKDVPVWFCEGPVIVQGVVGKDGVVSVGVANYSGRDLTIVIRDITSGNKRVVPGVAIKCLTDKNTTFVFRYGLPIKLDDKSTVTVDVLDMDTGEELFMDNKSLVSGLE